MSTVGPHLLAATTREGDVDEKVLAAQEVHVVNRKQQSTSNFTGPFVLIPDSRHAQRVLALDAGHCASAGCVAHLHRAWGAVHAGAVFNAGPAHVRALLHWGGVGEGSVRARNMASACERRWWRGGG